MSHDPSVSSFTVQMRRVEIPKFEYISSNRVNVKTEKNDGTDDQRRRGDYHILFRMDTNTVTE